jgi:hypothetical protein
METLTITQTFAMQLTFQLSIGPELFSFELVEGSKLFLQRRAYLVSQKTKAH